MENIYNYETRQVGTGNQLVNALAQLQVDAAGNYEGRNNLLTSLLLPKQQAAMYPPSGRQQTNTKAVDIATLVAVESKTGFTNDLMFVIPEESPVPFIHVFRRSNQGYNHFHGFIRTSESLQDTAKYRSSRLVSSIIEIVSDTRPGGNFDISGQFNAITLAYLPPKFQNLDHNQLLKFKDSPAEVRTNVPILDGITYRKGLTQENPMLIRCELASQYDYGQVVDDETQWWRPINYATASQVVLTYSQTDFGKPGVSGRTATSATQPCFVIQGAATDRLPSLAMYHISFGVVFDADQTAQQAPVIARLYMRHADRDYLDVPLAYPNGAANIKSSNYMEATFYAFTTIEKVEVYLKTASDKGIFGQWLTLSCHLASNESVDKVATVISVRGVPDGVTYSISGRLNYEFIAGSELKADLVPENNHTTHTDLLAALRVQEYLCDAVAVGHVMTCSEYKHFVQEIRHNLFDRSRHSRYAFLGAILPALRTAVQYAPRIIQMGAAAQELTRDIQAAYRERKNQRRAMLGNDDDDLASYLPTRGVLAGVISKFNPAIEEAKLPEVSNLKHAGDRFTITRQFATVDEADQAETGDLTLSSEPLNKESYRVLTFDGVEVHHQDYDFGDQVVSPEILILKRESNAEDFKQTALLYRDQEPLRTVAWMAKQKQMKSIYLTSSLENVRGGSIGFTLEAIWFGYTDDYVYTGSSSPETTWLPSYNLGKGLALKAQLPKIAAKTIAAELRVAPELGYTTPLHFDGGDAYPAKVCVESSSWFMEMLLETTGSKSAVTTKVQTVVKTVYEDTPQTIQLVQQLQAQVHKLTQDLKKQSPVTNLAEYFVNQAKVEEQADEDTEVIILPTVNGYPHTDVEMEDAEAINHVLRQIEERQVPTYIPESVIETILRMDKDKAEGLRQFVRMINKTFTPNNKAHGYGLVSAFKAFLRTQLEMPEEAVLQEGPGQGMTLVDFLHKFGGVSQARPGFVTNSEYAKALAVANLGKAVKKGRISEEEKAKKVAEMFAPKETQGEKKRKKKAKEADARVLQDRVELMGSKPYVVPSSAAMPVQSKAPVSGGTAMQRLMAESSKYAQFEE